MLYRNLALALRMAASAMALQLIAAPAAHAQLTVIDPTNLVQNALNATRALQQINNQVTQITNQIRQLENEARNLTRLDQTFAPDILGKLRDLDMLILDAQGLALHVAETRAALDTLYSGDYRDTDMAMRARAAARQMDHARSALQTALVLQAKVTEQLREDQRVLDALASASTNAAGALAAQQAANELLAFQAQQTMRLQALLVAQSRADALAQARDMEALAQARAQHQHFFSGARSAHPKPPPWD